MRTGLYITVHTLLVFLPGFFICSVSVFLVLCLIDPLFVWCMKPYKTLCPRFDQGSRLYYSVRHIANYVNVLTWTPVAVDTFQYTHTVFALGPASKTLRIYLV